MQVSLWVKECLDESSLSHPSLSRPNVLSSFVPYDEVLGFCSMLDEGFFNVFNQPYGYYQLKRHAAASGNAVMLSFMEDCGEFRLSKDPNIRLRR